MDCFLLEKVFGNGVVTYITRDPDTWKVLSVDRAPIGSLAHTALERMWNDGHLAAPWKLSVGEWETILQWAYEETRKERNGGA